MAPTVVSCITYKQHFKIDDLREAEIKITYADDSSKKAKCPKFSGKGGIEELMLIVEMFEDICVDLRVPDDDKFEHFKTILEHGPRTKWAKLDPDGSYTQDEAGFNSCMSNYYKSYASAKDARDVFIKYLESTKVSKREDVSIEEHVERIDTLCRYANKLHGTGALLLDATKKTILFDSFPESWTETISRGALHYSEMDEQEIITQMMKEQVFHAKKALHHRGKRKYEGEGDGYQQRRGGGRGRKRGGRGFNKEKSVVPAAATTVQSLWTLLTISGNHTKSECEDASQRERSKSSNHTKSECEDASQRERSRHPKWGSDGSCRSIRASKTDHTR